MRVIEEGRRAPVPARKLWASERQPRKERRGISSQRDSRVAGSAPGNPLCSSIIEISYYGNVSDQKGRMERSALGASTFTMNEAFLTRPLFSALEVVGPRRNNETSLSRSNKRGMVKRE